MIENGMVINAERDWNRQYAGNLVEDLDDEQVLKFLSDLDEDVNVFAYCMMGLPKGTDFDRDEAVTIIDGMGWVWRDRFVKACREYIVDNGLDAMIGRWIA